MVSPGDLPQAFLQRRGQVGSVSRGHEHARHVVLDDLGNACDS